MKSAAPALITLLVAVCLTVVWWRLWMYDGLVGPPAFLSPLIPTDGEGTYDRVMAEMLIVVWTIIGLGTWLGRGKARAHRGG